MRWREWAETETRSLHQQGRWRAPRTFDSHGPVGRFDDGKQLISFASNDYLGLSQHPDVIAAAHTALDEFGAGSGSARLIVGARSVHAALETALANWKHTESSVLFPSGFAANLGVLGAFADANTLICSDELNHASIIDGARLSKAEIQVFRHRDLQHLESLLLTAGSRRTIIVSDTVFSMDGDHADVDRLIEIAREHHSLLIVDEAHSVLGPYPEFHDVAYLRVGTMSKTLGALGGFVAGPRTLTDLIVNRARTYIFTTAATPADTAAALAAVTILQSPPGAELVQRLRRNVDRVRGDHPSPIISHICGSEEAAVTAAAVLLDQGLLVPAIRPPTVAPGTCRLRITLSALHTDTQIDQLLAALRSLPSADPNTAHLQ